MDDFMSPYIHSKVQVCIQYYGLLQDVTEEVQTINYASVIRQWLSIFFQWLLSWLLHK